jgi:histidyl-tRNA synthetase
MTKPSIPQGTRDFSAETIYKRNFILNSIRSVFELYGFQPLETPAMENLETLMGKYGDEGDKLIFKILNNGISDPKNTDKAKAGFEKVLEGKNSTALTERALKYDLTIPFARYVAMNQGSLTFPFKRYQMQPVWRADRPQKGRYREFTQCDADVVGSSSLINEIELCNIYHSAFKNMGLNNYTLNINSRKLLAALAEKCGGAENMIPITVAIDKLDKIGLDKVKEELTDRGILPDQISIIEQYLSINGSNDEKLLAIQQLFGNNETAQLGLAELGFVVERTRQLNVTIDLTLARGLNYYTGIIFEAKAPAHVKMGSIGGGGRYDDLTGLFGVPGIAGVGISFGVDRIYDVLEELQLFPDNIVATAKALFFNLGVEEASVAFEQAQLLRAAGISCELYHEAVKMDKQFKYADKKNIPFAIIIGSKEITSATAVVKNLKTGEQQNLPFVRLIEFFTIN